MELAGHEKCIQAPQKVGLLLARQAMMTSWRLFNASCQALQKVSFITTAWASAIILGARFVALIRHLMLSYASDVRTRVAQHSRLMGRCAVLQHSLIRERRMLRYPPCRVKALRCIHPVQELRNLYIGDSGLGACLCLAVFGIYSHSEAISVSRSADGALGKDAERSQKPSGEPAQVRH